MKIRLRKRPSRKAAAQIEITRMHRRLCEAEHYESMLLNHVPRDMWDSFGIYPYEGGRR